MRSFRVLLVDDEERILNFLTSKLNATGYDVLTARDGVEALQVAKNEEPDMVVLDIVMPKMDGFETLKQLRTFSTSPVIFLSARGVDADKIKGLTMGADDYLPKPFNPDELVARIEAVRRRLSPTERRVTPEKFVYPGLDINFESHDISVRGQAVHLTRIEWLLLSELVRNAGRLVTYEDMLIKAWGPEYRDDVQLLRTWVSRLRFKIEENPNDPKIIRTIPKSGYIIDKPEEK
jgi:two-component system KDP operon response regulator KdpE